MSIEILNAGPLTTVQDAGRFGFLEAGIGTAGVMDRKAYLAANRLVGNDNNEAVLEFTLFGGQIKFESDAIAAITGADMQPTVDGEAVDSYRPIKISAGQVLGLGMAVKGCRAYLAVRGGIDTKPVMNSRSTDLKAKIGGFEGRKLAQGDILKTGAVRFINEKEMNELLNRTEEKPVFSDEVTVRVIEGPQEEFFTANGIKNFYSEVYKVLPESDRMGIRVSGEEVESINGTDIVSDGIAFGSVQIPSSGQPIILMADHQTTGGYAKIATVVKEDLSLLAQLKPGNSIRFKKVDLKSVQPKKGFWRKLFG